MLFSLSCLFFPESRIPPIFLRLIRNGGLLFLLLHSSVDATVQITLEGVAEEALQTNIRAFLSLEQQKDSPHLTAKRVQQLHQQAPSEIKQALQPFGYYRAEVIDSQLTEKPTGWQAKYVIKLGIPLKVETVTLNLSGAGKTDEAFQTLLAELPLKKGKVLNHAEYEDSKKKLSFLAQERGYFDAHFIQHEIRVDEQAYTARINLAFETGNRYRFGEITFKQDFFAETLLARFLTFAPGDFYSSNQLLAFQNALTDSDYFQLVEVEGEPTTEGDEEIVPVIVTLVPRKANKFSVGIGYGTDTGVRGSLEWERRRINRWGHRFAAGLQLSEVRNSVTARYLIPTGKIKEDYFSITAGYRDETTDTSKSELFLIGASKNQLRSLFGRGVHQVVGIEYRDEIYQIGSDSGHAKLLMPNLSLTYAKADNRIYTTHGQKIQLNLRGAQKSFGSNTSFLQAQLSGIFIRQFTEQGRVIVRGEVGHTATPSFLEGEFNKLPPSIRFFTGGDHSVRGYDYKSLGPKNIQGEVVGGKNLLVGSVEYEHRLFDKWGVAAFYDVGNAFDGFSVPLKHGAGLGVRWLSPVGAVRVDVAIALSEEDNYPLRLHITVGPDF